MPAYSDPINEPGNPALVRCLFFLRKNIALRRNPVPWTPATSGQLFLFQETIYGHIHYGHVATLGIHYQQFHSRR